MVLATVAGVVLVRAVSPTLSRGPSDRMSLNIVNLGLAPGSRPGFYEADVVKAHRSPSVLRISLSIEEAGGSRVPRGAIALWVNNEVILDVGEQRSNKRQDPGWVLCCHEGVNCGS
jgi:hypothetical protein